MRARPGMRRGQLRVRSLIAGGLLASGVAVGTPAETPSENPAATGVEIHHLAPVTVAEVGRTRVIAFLAAESADHDRAPTADVDDRGLLEIVRPPAVLAGETIGYLRVRGLAPGETSIHVAGTPLNVRVVAPRAPDAADRDRPRIIGPVTGAVVWGEITVGVEVRLRPPGVSEARPAPVHLLLPDGTRLDPDRDSGNRNRPVRRVAFTLDTEPFAAGGLDLVPVTRTDSIERRGAPVRVVVIDPDPADLFAGEAETHYDVERPRRFADERMHVGRHRDASGGAYFSNASANPAVCFPVTAPAEGWYQVMLRVGGTSAQGALPTVGIVVDGENQSRTNARLLDESWHRLAAGVPFRLSAGRHVITPFFVNDFYAAGLADRNLHIDRIEVLRLGASGGDARAGDGVMTAGMGGAMAGAMPGGIDAAVLALPVDDHFGAASAPLRIAFVRPLHGLPLPGTTEIEGRAWWAGHESTRAPVVTLWVNDEPVRTQRSGAPRFWVDSSHFKAGANRIKLVARSDDGVVASTPVQTMHWSAAPPLGVHLPARDHRRFSIHEEGWDETVADRLVNRRNPKERRALAFDSEGTATLALPEDLAGSFVVFLEVLGEHFEGAPVARVEMQSPGATVTIGEIEAPTWWNTRRVGRVDLPAGPKSIAVTFTNDRFERDAGDRNLLVQSVILAAEPVIDDRTPPFVAIDYPENGQSVFMADALVAEASDDTSLANAVLLLDGMETGINQNLNARPGQIVLPLALRSVSPGPHELTLRVTDLAGNSTVSEPCTIVVTRTPPAEPGPYDRAVRVLNVFGYGPAPGDLAAILTSSPEAWLETQLTGPVDDPGDLAALAAGFPYFVNRNPYEVESRTISHLILTPRPARARFVLWAENHFSTWIRKIQGQRKWVEHLTFTRLSAAPFDTLLFASAESPAMLAYLDQDVSYAGRLNENYAREIMELHTLGVHGGYDQPDVTNLAHLLTGWTAALEGDGRGGGQGAQRYTFRFDPRLSDPGATEVVGLAFAQTDAEDRYDRARLAIEMLAAHPSTARFVSERLAGHYVRTPPPEDLVESLTMVFHESGGDMRAMLLAIAAHPALHEKASTRIATPVEYAVRLSRTTSHYQPWRLRDFLQRSGHGIFDRPTPDGYPTEDTAYSDSNAMVQRWRLAQDAMWQLAAFVPGPLRYSPDLPEDEWKQRVVDVVAIRLTGRVLGPASNEAALVVLTSTDGSRDARVRVIAPFIAQLPEANLR